MTKGEQDEKKRKRREDERGRKGDKYMGVQ